MLCRPAFLVLLLAQQKKAHRRQVEHMKLWMPSNSCSLFMDHLCCVALSRTCNICERTVMARGDTARNTLSQLHHTRINTIRRLLELQFSKKMDLRLLSQCQARSIDLGHPGLRCGLLLSICKLTMGSVIAYAFPLIISYAVADTFVYSAKKNAATPAGRSIIQRWLTFWWKGMCCDNL